MKFEALRPTPVGLLWFSAPTDFNHKFVKNRTKIAKFRKIVNHAIKLSCNIVLDQDTPKSSA